VGKVGGTFRALISTATPAESKKDASVGAAARLRARTKIGFGSRVQVPLRMFWILIGEGMKERSNVLNLDGNATGQASGPQQDGHLAQSCDFKRGEYRSGPSNDDLSSTTGTETLLAHDMVLEGLPASSKGPAE
jgi:hypothetical protein